MPKPFAAFLRDESGATSIEYGLIAALVALAIVIGARNLGNSINSMLVNEAAKVDTIGP